MRRRGLIAGMIAMPVLGITGAAVAIARWAPVHAAHPGGTALNRTRPSSTGSLEAAWGERMHAVIEVASPVTVSASASNAAPTRVPRPW